MFFCILELFFPLVFLLQGFRCVQRSRANGAGASFSTSTPTSASSGASSGGASLMRNRPRTNISTSMNGHISSVPSPKKCSTLNATCQYPGNRSSIPVPSTPSCSPTLQTIGRSRFRRCACNLITETSTVPASSGQSLCYLFHSSLGRYSFLLVSFETYIFVD